MSTSAPHSTFLKSKVAPEDEGAADFPATFGLYVGGCGDPTAFALWPFAPTPGGEGDPLRRKDASEIAAPAGERERRLGWSPR